ncbi:MAG: universal stress protein [Rhodospirillales bacterium]|nr:universal stress protein [Rhodospirillales bacterium]
MYNRILAVTDGSDHAQKALVAAGQMAVRFQSEVTVLNVFSTADVDEATLHMADVEHLVAGGEPTPADPAMATASPLGTDTSYEAKKDGFMYRTAEEISHRIVDEGAAVVSKAGASQVVPVVRQGDPAEEILEVARDEKADLIVLGSRGLGTLKGLLMGSVSSKVNQHSHCDCLIVK